MEKNIYLGCDHVGYELKEGLKKYLLTKNQVVIDLGSFSTESVDYKEIAREVAEKIVEEHEGPCYGILTGESGENMMAEANRFKGVRAADCADETAAKTARTGLKANVLCIGAGAVNLELAKRIVDAYLE